VHAVVQSIEFKGTTLPVIAVALPCLDPADLTKLAHTRFGGSEFFDGDAAILELGQLEDALTADWLALRTVFATHGLVVIGVRGGPAELQADARAAGLMVAPPERTRGNRRPPVRDEHVATAPLAPVTTGETSGRTEATELYANAATPIPEPTPATLPAPAAQATAPANPVSTATSAEAVLPQTVTPTRPSMIVDRPLRSGQQVYARNADLIVMAVVSHGAEVIADGSIHVYAPLRGRALAGAAGDTGARIFTTRFEAELVSVAGVYRTFEGGVPAEFASHPTQVRLVGEGDVQKLSITPLSTT
jgi:septum site-determining protein MinC